jgi:transposase
VRHRYHALECACGVRTAARPGVGVLSTVPGRSRDLLLSEACLVGPTLATFIAALSVRYHVSRAKIREFLAVWFGVPLARSTAASGKSASPASRSSRICSATSARPA